MILGFFFSFTQPYVRWESTEHHRARLKTVQFRGYICYLGFLKYIGYFSISHIPRLLVTWERCRITLIMGYKKPTFQKPILRHSHSHFLKITLRKRSTPHIRTKLENFSNIFFQAWHIKSIKTYKLTPKKSPPFFDKKVRTSQQPRQKHPIFAFS